jgi:hypothetical protein
MQTSTVALMHGMSKPLVTPEFSAIPEEIKARPQWVLHRPFDGKEKVPHQPDGSLASVSNPKTWRSFDEVVAAYQKGGFDGISFAFTLDDPFCGVDLDHCRDPETGDIEQWARKIIEKVASYTEVSVSGTGLRIIAGANLPDSRCQGDLEIYVTSKFLTVTGWHLENTAPTIENAQDAMMALWQEVVDAQGGGESGKASMVAEDSIDWEADPESVQERLQAMLASDPGFRQTWEHKRPELGEDLSRIDLSLVSQAVLAPGWSNATDLYLLVRLHRQHWGNAADKKKATRHDYIRRTIGMVLAPPEEDEEVEVDFWPAPLGPAAFRGLAGEVVDTIFPHSEADRAALLVQFLAAFGNASDRNPHAKVEADRHGANLFVAIVGATGTSRKGTSWGHIRDLFKRAVPEWAKERILSGLATGEGLIYQVRDAVEKREPVKEKGQAVKYETVIIDHGVEDKRLLVLEPELASAFEVMARKGNTLSPVMRQAWDNNNLGSLPKHESMRATDPHISIVGHITAEELRHSLPAISLSNGLANRFLFICAKRSKYLPEGGQLSDDDRDKLAGKVKSALETAAKLGRLERDDEARAWWAEMYLKLSAGQAGLLGAATNRAEAQVLRLSLIYAMLDGSPVVRREHLQAAAEVWRYAENSVGYVFGNALSDPVAEKLLAAISGAGEAGLTLTQIRRDVFKRHGDTLEMKRALESLRAMGIITRMEIKTKGRSASRWKMTSATFFPPSDALSTQ